MSREPNRVQLSKLSYQENVPSFLQKLKARVSGQPVDEDEPSYSYDDEQGEWEESGDGRPAIPRRPDIPERPKEGQWGSNRVGKDGEGGPARGADGKDEDDEGEDAPQIVVLREGKHLSAEDVENERRAAKGLPPLPKARAAESTPLAGTPLEKSKPAKEDKSMNFSSSKKGAVGTGASSKKRKIVGLEDEPAGAEEKAPKSVKKPKKEKKALLSFQDDES